MKRMMYLGALVLGVTVCSQSFGFELLDRMLGCKGGASCCEPGCDAGAGCCEPGCGAEPACGAAACGACDSSVAPAPTPDASAKKQTTGKVVAVSRTVSTK